MNVQNDTVKAQKYTLKVQNDTVNAQNDTLIPQKDIDVLKCHFDGPKMTQCLWNLRSHGLNWPLVRYLTVGTARVPNDIWSWYNVLTNVTYVKQNWALLKSTFEDINVPKTFIFIDTVGAGIEVLRLRLTNKLTRFSTSIVYFQLIINRPR